MKLVAKSEVRDEVSREVQRFQAQELSPFEVFWLKGGEVLVL